jgi:hypothetical protein
MKRRRVLGLVGVSLTMGGCVGRSSPGSPGDDTPTETGSPGDDAPTVTDRAFSRSGDCQDPESASVSFPDDVLVTGCISGADGCAEAALGAADYDAGDDTLRVVVETVDTSKPGGGCTQAIVYRGYELRVSFDGELPGTVVVTHRGVEGETEVAREQR